MLTEQEAIACFDYICSCEKAHRSICQHFKHRPSAVPTLPPGQYSTSTPEVFFGVTLASMVDLAVRFARSDWDTNFTGKESQPTWRRHDTSTYVEQIVDLIMENKERFQ